MCLRSYLADVVGEAVGPLLRERGVEEQVQVRVRKDVLYVYVIACVCM